VSETTCVLLPPLPLTSYGFMWTGVVKKVSLLIFFERMNATLRGCMCVRYSDDAEGMVTNHQLKGINGCTGSQRTRKRPREATDGCQIVLAQGLARGGTGAVPNPRWHLAGMADLLRGTLAARVLLPRTQDRRGDRRQGLGGAPFECASRADSLGQGWSGPRGSQSVRAGNHRLFMCKA
jgi:hypothetical protein